MSCGDYRRKTRRSKKQKYKSSYCNLFDDGKCDFGLDCLYFHDGVDDYNELKKNGYNPPSSRLAVFSKVSSRPLISPYIHPHIISQSNNNKTEEKELSQKKEDDYKHEITTLRNLVFDMKYEIANLESTICGIKYTGGYKVPLITSIDRSQKEYLNESSTFRWMWCDCTCGLINCKERCEYDRDISEFLEMVLNLKKKTTLDNSSLDNKKKKKVINIYNVKIGTNIYTIDIQKMTQTNQSTKTKRDIFRDIKTIRTKNPKWVIHADIKHQLQTFTDQFSVSYRSDLLLPVSSLFLSIEEDFLDAVNGNYPSMRSINAKVDRIFKVSNPEAAKLYEFKKQSMEDHTEAMLFHGTRNVNPEEVSRDGLDSRISNGGYFGRGIYTSRSPRYCHEGYVSSIDSCHVVLYVKALLGRMKIYDKNSRDHTLVRSPATYDSVCCDVDLFSTTVHTLYDRSQVYVSFIIYYKV
jgi:hypothetical protein